MTQSPGLMAYEPTAKTWPELHEVEWDRKMTDAKHGASTSRRNEPRVMIRVTCSSTMAALPGGVLAKHGVNTVLLYKSDLAQLKRVLPTEEERSEMARALREYDQHLVAYAQNATNATSGPEYEAALLKAPKVVGANPWGIFHRLRNVRHDVSSVRDYPCFDNLEVHCDANGEPVLYPAPETPQSMLLAQADAQTASIVAGLREVFGPLIDSFAGKAKPSKTA